MKTMVYDAARSTAPSWSAVGFALVDVFAAAVSPAFGKGRNLPGAHVIQRASVVGMVPCGALATFSGVRVWSPPM